jgi:transposase
MLNDLFTQALGLVSPWKVDQIDFNREEGAIHFHLSFAANRCVCPVCDAPDQPIHDRMKRSWQHLHFFQYRAFLHAEVPRLACSCGKTTQIKVPWANSGSGFTLLFEAYAMALARELPVAEVARMLGVRPQRLWDRLVKCVGAAYDAESFADLREITIDETAMRRRHQYVTVIADSVQRRVVFATEGKDSLTLSDFASELLSHNAAPTQIEHVAMDFSAAFMAGARDYLPNARISFDPFHLVALASEALDQVRRAEVIHQPSLKRQRYTVLKNSTQWTAQQAAFMATLSKSHLKTARAWRIKETVRDIVRDKADAVSTEAALRRLAGWAQRSQLEPMIRFGKTVRKHMDGIVRAISERRSNAFAEGLNSAIQAAKQRARGFKTANNFIAVIYLIAGKLKHLPTTPMHTRGSTTPAFA